MQWLNAAACRGMDPEWWFTQGNPARALRICAQCPVTAECLEYAMEREEPHTTYRYGIYGGLSADHRRKLARMR